MARWPSERSQRATEVREGFEVLQCRTPSKVTLVLVGVHTGAGTCGQDWSGRSLLRELSPAVIHTYKTMSNSPAREVGTIKQDIRDGSVGYKSCKL